MQGAEFQNMSLLEIKNLKIYLNSTHGVVKAADGVSFSIARGETLALVGESGSGKTMAALAITKLIPNSIIDCLEGEVIFNGRDLLRADLKELLKVRGGKISYIFQEPAASLNPVMRIGVQIAEAIIVHQAKSKPQALSLTKELLAKVGIKDPSRVARSYPHELSGGMKQRAMIAMAISSEPELLIADEATSALDVAVQEQILALLRKLKKEMNLSVLLITHNLGIVKDFAEKTAVIYQGKIQEQGLTKDVWSNPQASYTRRLLNCLPELGKPKEKFVGI